MKPLLLWIAVPLLLLGAAMLIAGIGASSLWICRDRGRRRVGRNWPGEAERRGAAVTMRQQST
jgi:hypothetical protein